MWESVIIANMTLESGFDLERDSEKFAASVQREPINIRAVVTAVLRKLSGRSDNWEDPKGETAETPVMLSEDIES